MRKMSVILDELEAARKKMVEYGMNNGFADPETVRLSEVVDTLHNEQMSAERAANKKMEAWGA